MEILRQALGELYEEFGHTEITLRLSQILDRYIAKEQKERLKNETSYKK